MRGHCGYRASGALGLHGLLLVWGLGLARVYYALCLSFSILQRDFRVTTAHNQKYVFSANGLSSHRCSLPRCCPALLNPSLPRVCAGLHRLDRGQLELRQKALNCRKCHCPLTRDPVNPTIHHCPFYHISALRRQTEYQDARTDTRKGR